MFIVMFLVLDVALAAVLVPVLVIVLTALIVIVVCAWHWRNRYVVFIGTWNLVYENVSVSLHDLNLSLFIERRVLKECMIFHTGIVQVCHNSAG